MGGGQKGGGSSSTTSTSIPWTELQPFLKSGLQATAKGFGLDPSGKFSTSPNDPSALQTQYNNLQNQANSWKPSTSTNSDIFIGGPEWQRQQANSGGGATNPYTQQASDAYKKWQDALANPQANTSATGLDESFIGTPYAGDTVAPDSQYTTEALNSEIARARAGTPYLGTADNYMQDILSGKYLSPDSNPWLKSTYDQAAKSVTDNYNNVVNPGIDSHASMNGRYGSGAYAQARNTSDTTLGHDLNDLATNIYGNAYNTERQLQTGAITAIPQMQASDYYDANQLAGVGDYYTNLGQQKLDAQINQYNQKEQLPLTTLQTYNNIINGYPDPMSTTATSTQRAAAQKAGGAGGAAGGALQGSSMGNMFGPWGTVIGGVGGALVGGFSKSDIFLKENIIPMGMENNIPVYIWQYKGADRAWYYGVIAQQILQIKPSAVSLMSDGFLAVDYNQIQIHFRRLTSKRSVLWLMVSRLGVHLAKTIMAKFSQDSKLSGTQKTALTLHGELNAGVSVAGILLATWPILKGVLPNHAGVISKKPSTIINMANRRLKPIGYGGL